MITMVARQTVLLEVLPGKPAMLATRIRTTRCWGLGPIVGWRITAAAQHHAKEKAKTTPHCLSTSRRGYKHKCELKLHTSLKTSLRKPKLPTQRIASPAQH